MDKLTTPSDAKLIECIEDAKRHVNRDPSYKPAERHRWIVFESIREALQWTDYLDETRIQFILNHIEDCKIDITEASRIPHNYDRIFTVNCGHIINQN